MIEKYIKTLMSYQVLKNRNRINLQKKNKKAPSQLNKKTKIRQSRLVQAQAQ